MFLGPKAARGSNVSHRPVPNPLHRNDPASSRVEMAFLL